MKKTLLTFAAAIVATTVAVSQIQVGKTGKVTIGVNALASTIEIEPEPPGFDTLVITNPPIFGDSLFHSDASAAGIALPGGSVFLKGWTDTITSFQIYGPLKNNAGARMAFSSQPALLPRRSPVIVGELGTTATGKLWLHGPNGICLTSGAMASDTIAFYNDSQDKFFQFNCDVRSTGLFIPSDSRFKTDINPIDNVASALDNLTAVSYRLKPNFGNAEASEVGVSTASATQTGTTPIHYGFLAEDVEEVLPDLVRTDSTGYKFVDYIGMIPLLVESLKQMQAKTDSLETVVNTLKNTSSNPKQSAPKSGGNSQTAELFQNSPNPFNAATEIKCVLPYEAKSAFLYIYDLQGSQKMKMELSGRGTVTSTIRSSDLPAGMYIYSLIVDGNEIDSKRMILTD